MKNVFKFFVLHIKDLVFPFSKGSPIRLEITGDIKEYFFDVGSI